MNNQNNNNPFAGFRTPPPAYSEDGGSVSRSRSEARGGSNRQQQPLIPTRLLDRPQQHQSRARALLNDPNFLQPQQPVLALLNRQQELQQHVVNWLRKQDEREQKVIKLLEKQEEREQQVIKLLDKQEEREQQLLNIIQMQQQQQKEVADLVSRFSKH